MTAPRKALDVAANPRRVTRFDVNDASRITFPLTRPASERTTVSTSGSSGKFSLPFGHVHEDVYVAQFYTEPDQRHAPSIEG